MYNPYSVVHITNYFIDGTEDGDILIGTTLPDRLFVPLSVSLSLQSFSDLTITPTVAIGFNEGSYNNILPPTSMATITVDKTGLSYLVSNPVSELFGGTDIYANITIAASATTYLIRASVIGYYY